jgi:hypothetical protein
VAAVRQSFGGGVGEAGGGADLRRHHLVVYHEGRAERLDT